MTPVLRTRLLLLTLLTLVAAMATPITAHAGMRSVAYSCGHGTEERGSGQTDTRGWFYLPCEVDHGVDRPHVRVMDPGGVVRQYIPIDFRDGFVPRAGCDANYVGDVAPSPDGSYLYIVRHCAHTIHRLDRGANGTYTLNPTWKLANYTIEGDSFVANTEFITTDALGNIYISAGTWVDGAPKGFVKYTAAGAIVTTFGYYRDKSWALGTIYWLNAGLTVSADGRTVYTTEVGNSRIQIWQVQLDGTYRATKLLGNTELTDPTREGICNRDGLLAAPYDVALGPDGTVNVINTTCIFNETIEVQRWSANGVPLTSLHAYAPTGNHTHGIAVDGRGVVFTPQGGVAWVPDGIADPSPEVVPVGDTTAPILGAVAAPVTSTVRAVTIGLTATDNVGVTQSRISIDADIATAPWTAFAGSPIVTLPDIAGPHVVRVQVRDAAGNVSTLQQATITYAPIVNADVSDPGITVYTIPATTTSRTITITLDAVDNIGVTQMRLANDVEDITTKPWVPFLRSFTHTINDGAGDHKVYVVVRDAAGNQSWTIFRTTTYAPVVGADVTPPTLGALTLPATTNVASLSLTLAATDNIGVTHVRAAAEGEVITSKAWVAIARPTPVALSYGYGAKSVSIQVRDAAGNMSVIRAGTTTYRPITDDALAPGIVKLTAPATTRVATFPLTLNAVDDVAPTHWRYSVDGALLSAAVWRTYTTAPSVTIPAVAGAHVVKVQVKDATGRTSWVVWRTITYAP